MRYALVLQQVKVYHQEDVGCLQVKMDDAFVMQVEQAASNVQRNLVSPAGQMQTLDHKTLNHGCKQAEPWCPETHWVISMILGFMKSRIVLSGADSKMLGPAVVGRTNLLQVSI